MMRLRLWIGFLGPAVAGASACSGDEATPEVIEEVSRVSEAEGAASVESAGPSVEPVEPSQSSVDPSTGIHPLSPESLGVCRIDNPGAKTKSCDGFVGREVEGLAPGNYVFWALWDVPDDDKEWPIRVRRACKTQGSSVEPTVKEKTRTVQHGGPNRGYRSWYLTFNVPEDTWASECEWTLLAPHPEGDHTYTVSWKFESEQ